MARRLVVGVIGAGLDARPGDVVLAERLGELVAEQGWVLLSGGRDAGVMAAVNRGAKRVPGSITVGVLPSNGSSKNDGVSPDVDVALFTGMGDGRNVINVLSSAVRRIFHDGDQPGIHRAQLPGADHGRDAVRVHVFEPLLGPPAQGRARRAACDDVSAAVPRRK